MKSTKNQKGFAPILLILLLAVIITVGGIVFWRMKNANDKKTSQAQQAKQQQQSIEDNLVVFTNRELNYGLKIPKNYIPTKLEGNPRYFYDRDVGRVDTPYTLIITSTPKGEAPAYTNDQAAEAALGKARDKLDNSLESGGWKEVVTVTGDIKASGTSYKRGIFATGVSYDDLGRETINKMVIILRDDGSGIIVAAAIRPEQESKVQAEIDEIFKSINLKVE
ncbi:MAG: hypothetical protein V4702_05390 [Patescibacteria group bacterium]